MGDLIVECGWCGGYIRTKEVEGREFGATKSHGICQECKALWDDVFHDMLIHGNPTNELESTVQQYTNTHRIAQELAVYTTVALNWDQIPAGRAQLKQFQRWRDAMLRLREFIAENKKTKGRRALAEMGV